MKTSLGEVRTLVLGAQILLGFQYRAAFEPAFLSLPRGAQVLTGAALLLLVASTACLIAPSSYHRIVAHGEATAGMERFTKWMAAISLALFTLALGADLSVALARQLGLAAVAVGTGGAVFAAACWFGPVVMAPSSLDQPQEDEMVCTKEKIAELQTEARIILPGVQALLGFQFASYLTKTFEGLPTLAKFVNTASLLLLVVAMVLLMTPSPYHRLAEKGEDSQHFERVAERLVLASLLPLALGISGDVFVVTGYIMGWIIGAAAALLSAIGMALLWFALPRYVARAADFRAAAAMSAGRPRQ